MELMLIDGTTEGTIPQGTVCLSKTNKEPCTTGSVLWLSHVAFSRCLKA